MDNCSDDVVLKKWMETALFPYLKNYELIEPDTVKYPNDSELTNVPGIRFSDGLLYHNNQQVHMFFDVNGFKGPNKAGRDLFYFFLDYNNIGRGYFYPSGYAYSNNGNEDEAPVDNYVYNDREGMKKYCPGKNVYHQNLNTCALLIMHDGWKIKDDYPASY